MDENDGAPVQPGPDDMAFARNGTDTKDRLSLSVHSSVKDRAKDYADAQGTSVSALVEEFLGEIVTEVRTRRYAPPASVMEATRSRISLGDLKVLVDAVDGSYAVAYLSTGELLVDIAAPLGWRAMRARASLREQGLPVTAEWVVTAGEIAAVNALARSLSAAPGTAEVPAPRPADARSVRDAFVGLLEAAVAMKATDIHVAVEGGHAAIRYRVKGRMADGGEIPVVEARNLQEGAYGLSRPHFQSGRYDADDYQQATVDPGKLTLPEALEAVQLRYLPGFGGDRCMVASLGYARVGNARGETLSERGFLDIQVATIAKAASRRGGLFVVADSAVRGSVPLTMRAMLAEHPLIARSATAVSVGWMGEPVPGVIRAQHDREFMSYVERIAPDIVAIGHCPNAELWKEIGKSLVRGVQVWVCVDAANARAAMAVAIARLSADPVAWAAADHGIVAVWQQSLRDMRLDGTGPDGPVVAAEVLSLGAHDILPLRGIPSRVADMYPALRKGGNAALIARRLAKEGLLDAAGVAEVFGDDTAG